MDLGVWNAVFVQAPLHEDGATGPRLWLDLHARRDGGRFTGLARPALGWDLSERTSVFVGYGAIVGAAPEEPATLEHRIWQQLTWSGTAGRIGLGLRPRLEQRLAADVGGVGHRARLMGRVQAPISERVAAVASDEVFVALNDSGFVPAGFDQNRLFVGPAILGDGFRVEVGVLDQRLLRDGVWSSVAVGAASLFVSW